MSLFAIYFEVGKPVPTCAVSTPLVAHPMRVRLNNKSARSRAGLALSDGVSAGAIRCVGNKAVARHGAQLRDALARYLMQRLKQGASPHLVLLTFSALVEEAVVNYDSTIDVSADNVADMLPTVAEGQVVRVLLPGGDTGFP